MTVQDRKKQLRGKRRQKGAGGWKKRGKRESKRGKEGRKKQMAYDGL